MKVNDLFRNYGLMYPNEMRPIELINPEFHALHSLYGHNLINEDSAADGGTVTGILLHGDDFYFKTFMHDYVTSRVRYYIFRSNAKRVFAQSEYIMSRLDLYYKDLAAELKEKLPSIKINDFLPLSEYTDACGSSYWSGYYGVRPTVKYIVKKFGQIMRQTGHLMALHLLTNGASLKEIKEAHERLEIAHTTQGLLTHHDSITATSNMNTIKSYFEDSYKAIRSLNDAIKDTLNLTNRIDIKFGLPWTDATVIPASGSLVVLDSAHAPRFAHFKVSSLALLPNLRLRHRSLAASADTVSSLQRGWRVVCDKVIDGCRVEACVGEVGGVDAVSWTLESGTEKASETSEAEEAGGEVREEEMVVGEKKEVKMGEGGSGKRWQMEWLKSEGYMRV